MSASSVVNNDIKCQDLTGLKWSTFMCLFSFLSTFVLSGNVSILPIDQLFTWPNSSTSIELEMGKKRKKFWHSLTTAADPVLNNFISERVRQHIRTYKTYKKKSLGLNKNQVHKTDIWSQWGIFACWRFLSDISATRARIHTKYYLCTDNVCRRAPSPCGIHRPLGAGGGGVKN